MANTKEDALKRLRKACRKGEELEPLRHSSPEFDKWKRNTKIANLGLIRFGGHLPRGEYDVDHDGHAGQADAAELHG